MAKKSVESSSEPRETDLRALLGRFSDARCVLECAVRSLEQWRELDGSETARRTDDAEVVCLRHALNLLADIYDDLDAAISLSRGSASNARE